jgi:hypothetical protein
MKGEPAQWSLSRGQGGERSATDESPSGANPNAEGPQPIRTATARRVALALLALLVLNTALSFINWWPTVAILPDHRLAPEFVAAWLVLLVAVASRGPLPPRTVAAISLVYLALVIGRYGDVTIPALFGRPINLYWDAPQIPRFLWVTARDQGVWLLAAILVVVIALLVALYRVLRWAVGTTARDAVPYALRRRWTWIPTLVATIAVVVHQTGLAPHVTWWFVTKPVAPTYWRQATLLATAFTPARLAEALPRARALERAMGVPPEVALGGLRGRDFQLFFLESYGAVAYEDAAIAPRLATARKQLAAEIAASGRVVASAFVRSPTFAGASDLAHLTLLSGIDLSDPMRHDLLLTTHQPTLVRLFHRAGYETVGLYPALSWDWAERAYYGFDLFLDGRDLAWRGPPLGYWKIPDQFTIARFEEMHPLRPDSPPRFLFFPTITSHLPFGPVPPYQSDWERVLSAEPFDAEVAARLQRERVDWLDMRPGYVGMFAYTYRWLGGYLQRPEPRESVTLWIGDHQPASSVSGEGTSWDVPVHVVTRDRELLARFVALGFRPGLEPQRPILGGMHELTALLLQAFADPSRPEQR